MSKQQWIAIDNPIRPARQGKSTMMPGEALQHLASGLRVFETTDVLADGRRYMHLSISHPDRYPTWEELIMVKEHFLQPEDEAVQVLPRKSEYVNVHPNCFHLWYCYDGDIIGR